MAYNRLGQNRIGVGEIKRIVKRIADRWCHVIFITIEM